MDLLFDPAIFDPAIFDTRANLQGQTVTTREDVGYGKLDNLRTRIYLKREAIIKFIEFLKTKRGIQ